MLFHYPAVAEGLPPGSRTDKTCVVVRQREIDVPQLDGESAPVVCELVGSKNVFGQATRVEIGVRSYLGGFYVLSGHTPENLPKILERAFVDVEHGFRTDLIDRVRARLALLSGPSKEWPKFIGAELVSARPGNAARLSLLMSRDVVLSAAGEADVAQADSLAAAMDLHWIVVDGELWKRVPEPHYTLSLGKPSTLAISTSKPAVIKEDEAHVLRFPLPRLDKALDATASFGGKPPSGDRARIHDPLVFSSDFNAENFARFCKQACATVPRGHVDDPDYAILKRVLEIAGHTKPLIGDIDIEALDAVMEEAFALDDAMAASSRYGRGLLACSPNLIALHRRLWTERDIEIGPAFGGNSGLAPGR